MELYANNAFSTLVGAITNVQTTLVVTSPVTFPATGNFRIVVESEYMLVTAVAGSTFTVTRGIEGSAAAAHANGLQVTHILTKGGLDQILVEQKAQLRQMAFMGIAT